MYHVEEREQSVLRSYHEKLIQNGERDLKSVQLLISKRTVFFSVQPLIYLLSFAGNDQVTYLME